MEADKTRSKESKSNTIIIIIGLYRENAGFIMYNTLSYYRFMINHSTFSLIIEK